MDGSETFPASGNNRTRTEWNKKQNKALNCSVQSEVFHIVKDTNEDDQAADWRAMKGNLEKRTTSRHFNTLKQLMEPKKDEYGSVQKHFREHKEIIADIQKVELQDDKDNDQSEHLCYYYYAKIQ